MNIHPDLIASMAQAHLADLHAEAARSRFRRLARHRANGGWWRRPGRSAPELRLVPGGGEARSPDIDNRVA